MKYKVTSQFPRDSERQLAMFEALDDAKTFVQAKIEKDIALKIKVIYRIFKDFDTLVEEIDSEKEIASTQSQGSQGQTTSASFRPSPFNTTAKPAGAPKKWVVNPDDEKKKG